MPRVENRGRNVSAWCQETGEGSSTHDVCRGCYIDLLFKPHAFDEDLKPYNGDPVGTAGWAGDVEHPSYDDDDIRCAMCKGTQLNEGYEGSGYDIAATHDLLHLYDRSEPITDQERGLYSKYHVRRVYDPENKHERCPFFVLDVRHDLHARTALLTYINSCRAEYPKLAHDLEALLQEETHGAKTETQA